MQKKTNRDVFPHRFRSRIALSVLLIFVFSSVLTFTALHSAHASAMLPLENNGLAQTPLMGWSSWSSIRSNPSEATIKAQAQAMASTLKSYGYSYINLDDFWYLNPATSVDQYGRWSVDTSRFPDGMAATASYVHSLGLKFGIYLTPGIPVAAVRQNTPIQGTSYHAADIANTSKYETNYNFGNNVMYYINYSKPGAQAFINSWADELASWGVDFLKIDGVGDADIADIQAWSTALKQSGRDIYFSLSNSLDVNNVSIWQQNANGWRISGDVECYCSTLVTWNSVSSRFSIVPRWVGDGGPGGWNDLDSLDVGNGSRDGLSNDERQSYMTLWAIEAAPLSIGDNLTSLDSYGLSLLTNTEVIAVDQAGYQAHPISQASSQQVWFARNGDGSYTVALFNLGSSTATVSVNWSSLGFSGSASVRDLWSHSNLGTISNSFSATLNTHASRLLKVTPGSVATPSHTATPNPAGYAVYAGVSASGSFEKDAYYNGGSTYSTTSSIDTSGVSNPAPQAVYQTERYGDFSYNLSGLTPGRAYTVRLHFAEIYWTSSGQRLFNVAINGQQVLTSFDIYATAGAANKAVVEQYNATADASGQIAVQFTSVNDNAKVNGIEVIGGSIATPTPTPTQGTTPTPTPTQGTGGLACSVQYAVTNQWPGGFGTSVTITNTGSTTINSWTLTWSFADGQTITQLWNGSYSQSGSHVSVTNASYNGTIAPGGTANFGFNGSWSNSNAAPTSFVLNGQTCATA